MFDGEAIELHPQRKTEEHFSDDEINEKYVRGEVRIVTEQARYPLVSVPQLLSSGDYLLRPEYQRRHRWSPEKKSRLIESLVMNVPVPPIFLYEYEFSKYEVMDGLQRLSTIHEFYEDRFELQGLAEWPELNGKKYSTLPSSIKAGVDRRYLSSIILLQETAKSAAEAQTLKQLVFERINSGGEKLTPQESRNAIYGGPMNDICLRLSRHPSLCLTWGIPLPTDAPDDDDDELMENGLYKQMDDVELVLRFFAFRQNPQYLGTSLRDYFDIYLQRANRFEDPLLNQLAMTFSETIDLAFDLLGPGAFWLWRYRNGKYNWYSRPTTVAYDTIMSVLSERLDRKDRILERSELIAGALPAFYQTYYDDFAGRYTNPSNILKRRELFATFIDSSIEG